MTGVWEHMQKTTLHDMNGKYAVVLTAVTEASEIIATIRL
jgi:hypothetical protein